MSRGHKPVTVEDNEHRHYGKCNCGWNSGANRFALKWQAEDACHTHLANVGRALASMRRRNPSLVEERDHARNMLDDPNVSADDKKVWQILYDGAAQRLNADGKETGVGELW